MTHPDRRRLFEPPDRRFVVLRRVDVGKRPVVVDSHVAGRASHVRARPAWRRRRIGAPQLVEQRPVDQQRMAVLAAARRPHDRRVRLVVPIDDGAHRRRRRRAARRRASRAPPPRPADRRRAARRAATTAGRARSRRFSTKRAGRPLAAKLRDDRVRVVADDDDHVVDAGVEERADDARQERLAVARAADSLWAVPCARICRPRARWRESRLAIIQCNADARIARMTDVDLHIRCQRCGTEMEMRDPGPGMPWTPDQFWVCPRAAVISGRRTRRPTARSPSQLPEPAS